MTVKNILVPLPSYGFDPTETAVPWKVLNSAGHLVTFATPNGQPGKADVRMVTGQDLGIFKTTLMADQASVEQYREMEQSQEFLHPIPYSEIDPSKFDALFLPGGHDKGMREYLESNILQNMIVDFFDKNKPVAAICHGVLLASRSRKPDGKSVLHRRKTTGLTQYQENVAHGLTFVYLGDYYSTYPEITMEEKVRRNMEAKCDDFIRGPEWYIPTKRDTPSDLSGFLVLDGNYLSARWPGDANTFARELVRHVEQTHDTPTLKQQEKSAKKF